MAVKVLQVGPLPTSVTGGVATAVYNLCRYLAKLDDLEVFLFADNIFSRGHKDWCVYTDGYTLYRKILPSVQNTTKYVKLFGAWPVIKTYTGAKWRGFRHNSWNTDISSYRYSLSYLYLRKIIERVQPDVIHAQHAHSRPVVSWLAGDGKIPVVITLQSFHASLDVNESTRLKMEALFKRNFELGSRIIAVSQLVKQQALELGAPAEKLVVIPNGVDTNAFSPVHKRQNLGRLSGTAQQEKRILFTGNLIPRKGIHILIQAFARVVDRIPESKLIIVGNGPQRSELQNLVNEYGLKGKITFVGGVPNLDLPQWYNACDLYVSTPSHEAQGIVFLEAMSCAKCCIGSNVGGIPMMIREGKTGFLVEYRDIVSLADKIEFLLRDRALAQKIGHQARDFVVKHFSWERITLQTRDLYLDIVDHRGRR